PAQPVLGRSEQGRCGLAVLGFEQTPIAGTGAHALLGGLGESERVDMRRDTPYRPPLAAREEELRPAMFEPGIFAGRQKAINLALERRDPRWIAAVEAESEFDELSPVGLCLDRKDGDRTLGVRGRGWIPELHYLCLSARH